MAFGSGIRLLAAGGWLLAAAGCCWLLLAAACVEIQSLEVARRDVSSFKCGSAPDALAAAHVERGHPCGVASAAAEQASCVGDQLFRLSVV